MTVASRAVLVVEDEPQLRRVLRTLLELENFRVIEAESAERGLAEARTHKPDLQVALRHTASAGAAGATLTIGVWQIDLKARSARDDGGHELHLTPIEYRLLEVLAQHIGLVVTHRALLQQVWGPGSAQQTQYLRVYMKQLRSKLEPDPTRPRWLLTETGVGYRLAHRE